jgi:hypothetical protein
MMVSGKKLTRIVKSRKGQVSNLSGKTLVEIIIFVIVFFIFLKLGAKVWDFYVAKPKTVTVNSFNVLHKHIKYFDKDFSDGFPLQVDERHIIKGFDVKNTNKPKLCDTSKSCICICEATCDDESITECKTIERASGKGARLTDEFIIPYDDYVKNYILELDDEGRFSINPEIK